MGTPFDFFDVRANTDHPEITAQQRDNRQRLRAAMEAAGFRNYPLEWWHFDYREWREYSILNVGTDGMRRPIPGAVPFGLQSSHGLRRAQEVKEIGHEEL